MDLYLGVDAGTQGVKAVLYDPEAGRAVARGTAPLELLPVDRPGAAEQDPAQWIEGMRRAVGQALAGAPPGARVAGLGVSGQQHGCVALDASGRVLRPAKLWCDTETAAEARELSERLGRPVPSGFTAPKVLWLARHEPEVFARLDRVLLPHDYLNLFLTGRAATEAGDASGTGYFDVEQRVWDSAAVEFLGLEGRLPEIVGPDAVLGELRPEAAEALGLPAGLPVAPGSGDNMMSALGAGAVVPGRMVLSLGTSGTLFGPSERPVLDPAGRLAAFCDATGRWLPLLCILNCTTVAEEVREATGLGHEELTRRAEEVPPGAGGLLFLPYLAGERTPDWPHARGVLLGLERGTLSDPGRLYRAALEGAALALREGYEAFVEHGLQARQLRLVGGGARNPLWARILADLFQVPLVFPEEPESAALGAALQAWAIVQGGPVAGLLAGHEVPLRSGVLEPGPAAPYEEVRARFHDASWTLFGA